MRINDTNESVDIEPRDMNYIFGSLIRSYRFYMKNQDPKEIIIPLVESIAHPLDKTKTIPVRYLPLMSPEALEIIHDGSNIPESTDGEEKADRNEEVIHAAAVASGAVKEEPATEIGDHIEEEKIEASPPPEPVPDTGKGLPERKPKMPDRPAEGHPDNMSSRGSDEDTRQVAKDLALGSGDVDEQPSKPYEKEIKRDPDTGEPIIEDTEEAPKEV